MNKIEFLDGLKKYLEPEVGADIVRENVDYYNRYISEEVSKGRSEEEVLTELGDPWVIAKTISDMYDTKDTVEDTYESTREVKNNGGSSYTFKFDTWLKKILLIVGIVAGLIFIFSLISGIVGLLAPILMPALVIMFVFRIFRKR